MTLKKKFFVANFLLHSVLFALTFIFYFELGKLLILVEFILVISIISFTKMINKALQPLEYIEIFSSILKEKEFTARFSYLAQKDLDQLIEQFNLMLKRLHQERLEIGEQKGVFQKLMTESPIGVVLFDYEDRISDVNPAAEKLLGITKQDVVEKNLNQINRSMTNHLKEIAIDSHQLVVAEQGRRLKIGHYAIRDRGFERSFFMLFEMTSEIIESQKLAYEKLIRLMSHEVNNTIAITNSLLESCLTFKSQLDSGTQEDFEKAVSIVINRCGSLNEFMQGYADIVKLSKPIRASFNLTKLVKDLTFLFHAECQKRDITIKFEQQNDLYINADASLIEQALMNVLKNSVEAIKDTGEICIELFKINDSIQLEVSDSGCGINDEVEQQLFTPFFTSKDSGQGLGLMLVREILKLHNFEFSLQNRIDCQGAIFRLDIKNE